MKDEKIIDYEKSNDEGESESVSLVFSRFREVLKGRLSQGPIKI